MQRIAASPPPQKIVYVTKMSDERLLEHVQKLIKSREGKLSKELLAQLIKFCSMPGWESFHDQVLNGATDWYKCNAVDTENNWSTTISEMLASIDINEGSRVPQTSLA